MEKSCVYVNFNEQCILHTNTLAYNCKSKQRIAMTFDLGTRQ